MRVKTYILACATTIAGLASCGQHKHTDATAVVAEGEVQRVLLSTPWLDHMPTNERDRLAIWMFGKGEGVFVDGSAYRGTYDGFRFRFAGEQLKVIFGQDGQAAATRYKLERVKQPPFGFKLTFVAPMRGPQVYFGFDKFHDEAQRLPAGVYGWLAGIFSTVEH